MLRDPVYLDTSALVKLISHETETPALIERIRDLGGQMATSEISEIECLRAVGRTDPGLQPAAARIFEDLVVLPLTPSMRLRASYLKPVELRSLDAIHLATAIEIQSSLACFLGYDHRLNEAARNFGLEVEAPA